MSQTATIIVSLLTFDDVRDRARTRFPAPYECFENDIKGITIRSEDGYLMLGKFSAEDQSEILRETEQEEGGGNLPLFVMASRHSYARKILDRLLEGVPTVVFNDHEVVALSRWV
jgi:hypothetical protein